MPRSLGYLLGFLTWALLMTGCSIPGAWSHPPPGWGDKAAIERIVRNSLPPGSSRQEVQAFFQRHGVKLIDLPRLQDHPGEWQVAHIVVRHLLPPLKTVSVTLHFAPDATLERTEFKETTTGL